MSLKEKVRDWLQVFRAHTAPATIILVLVSYLLGGGNLFTFDSLFLGIFALLFHWFTYGHNSLMDTVSGYDLKDKHKSHHPLVRGDISLEYAHKVIHSGLFILTLIGIWFALKSDGSPFLAVAWFTIFITAGHAYNDGLSKVTIWSFVPITICFTSFGIFGYYIAATEMSDLMFCVALYFAVTWLFQISLSGELKEITEREANLLRYMGARVSNNRLELGKAKYYGWFVKLLNLGGGCFIIYRFGFNLLSIALFALLASFAIYFCHELTKDRILDRNKSLVHMASEEIVTIYIMPAILIPSIGLAASATLMVFGIVYFIIYNLFLWGTILRPRV
ncbi:hypothetical protein ES705_18137 [subsurface metagenome]